MLSVIIPARNEQFLSRTIQSILETIESNTEVIAVLDGEWSNPPIPQHERVNVIYLPESIGQRRATNVAARLARGKYVMKVDAHCSFDQGFDRKMIEIFAKTDDNVTMTPVMKNLHAFDWVCQKCSWRKYQGPTPSKCESCGSTEVKMEMIWQPRANINNGSFCFDSEPHFQYFGDYKHRLEYVKSKRRNRYTETMSLQGSCFMCTREKYFELELCGENLGSWGNQGIEVACKTWLSGGRVLCNHNTWYAHMFRTQGGDFGFPYNNKGNDMLKTKKRVWELFFNNKWDKQIYPVSWLVEKFWPISWTDGNGKLIGWSQEDLDKLK